MLIQIRRKMSPATRIERERITRHGCEPNTSSPLRQVGDKPLSLGQGLVPGSSVPGTAGYIVVGDSCLL